MVFDRKFLDDFKKENGYSFFDMIMNDEIRKKHRLKQQQIPNYDDNDFLEEFQDKQGE